VRSMVTTSTPGGRARGFRSQSPQRPSCISYIRALIPTLTANSQIANRNSQPCMSHLWLANVAHPIHLARDTATHIPAFHISFNPFCLMTYSLFNIPTQTRYACLLFYDPQPYAPIYVVVFDLSFTFLPL